MEHADAALDEFMKLRLPIIDKHAPVKKLTVRTVNASWLMGNLKTVWLKEMGQKEWLISLAAHLTGLLAN